MLRRDSIVIFNQLRREFAAGRAPLRREIKRDQFLFFERFVIETNQAAVVPGHEIAFYERLNDVTCCGRRADRSAFTGQLTLIERVELARLLCFDCTPFGLRGNLFLHLSRLFGRNSISSTFERADQC